MVQVDHTPLFPKDCFLVPTNKLSQTEATKVEHLVFILNKEKKGVCAHGGMRCWNSLAVVSCPTWCWELKSGPLQEQYVGGLNCLAISPTPQPSHILAFKM